MRKSFKYGYEKTRIVYLSPAAVTNSGFEFFPLPMNRGDQTYARVARKFPP